VAAGVIIVRLLRFVQKENARSGLDLRALMLSCAKKKHSERAGPLTAEQAGTFPASWAVEDDPQLLLAYSRCDETVTLDQLLDRGVLSDQTLDLTHDNAHHVSQRTSGRTPNRKTFSAIPPGRRQAGANRAGSFRYPGIDGN
jgi:hypothetical protein